MPPLPRGFKIATIVSGLAWMGPVVIFALTHNILHPADSPGGFGEGYEIMWDGLKYSIVVVPAFFIFVISGLCWFVAAITDYGSWRFSLRTLLIATTLVAILLGLIAWAAK